MTGHPEFERAVRVQMNTIEQFVIFLPLLWLATIYFRIYRLAAGGAGLCLVHRPHHLFDGLYGGAGKARSRLRHFRPGEPGAADPVASYGLDRATWIARQRLL